MDNDPYADHRIRAHPLDRGLGFHVPPARGVARPGRAGAAVVPARRQRASAQMEMQAMDRMRAWLAEHHPATRETLLPTRIVRLEDIGPDAQIEQAFSQVLRLRGIGDPVRIPRALREAVRRAGRRACRWRKPRTARTA
jgi:hypothetical protein